MILLDIYEQREPYQKAIDALEQRRIDDLKEKISYLEKSLAKAETDELRTAIKGRIKEYQQEIIGYYSIKEAQPPQQPPAKGLLKGKDLVTPQQRVAGATPPKTGVAGAVKDVAGGLKRWLKGEPDQGPTYETKQLQEQNPKQGILDLSFEPKTPGEAIFQQLVMGYRAEVPYVRLTFLDTGDTQGVSKPTIYNILATLLTMNPNRRQQTIDNEFGNYETFMFFLNRVKPFKYRRPPEQLRINPGELKQPTVPANPPAQSAEVAAPAGPIYDPEFKKDLSERRGQKKKSENGNLANPQLNREIQKARARFPTAGSDIEALALDQMSVNDQQDFEIRNVDKELEGLKDQNLAMAQTVDSLSQQLNQLSVAKPASTTAQPAPLAPAPEVTPTKPSATQKAPSLPAPSDMPVDVYTKDLEARQKIDQLNQEIAKLNTAFALKSPSRRDDVADKIEKLQAKVFDLESERQQRLQKQQVAAAKRAETMAKKREAEATAAGELGALLGRLSPERGKKMAVHEGVFKNASYDLKVARDSEFEKSYGMTKDQFRKITKTPKSVKKTTYQAPKTCPQCGQSHEQCVCEGTAKQFGQAVRMAGYSGQNLEADPAEKFDRKIAGLVRQQDQSNLQKIKSVMKQRDDENDEGDWNDVDETFAIPGTTIPHKSVIQDYTVFFNPQTQVVSVTRGGDNEEAAIERAKLGVVNVKNFRRTVERLIDKIDDEIVNEGIKDAAGATAVIACLLTGGSLSGCATAPQQTSAQQVLKTGQDVGRTVIAAKKITRAGTEAEVNQEIRNLLRGVSGHPEELNNSNILRIWKKIKGAPPVPPEPEAPEYGPAEPRRRMPQSESTEPKTKQEFDRAQDGLLNQTRGADAETRKKINQQLRQLQDFGRAQGWFKGIVREDTAALAAEDAILKRIFVRHKDLMMEYGADKITQAAEAVAYNVGDIAHITDAQINEWVGQVEQILGARP